MIYSINEIMQDNHLTGGVLFACLLNFKHIYLYLAPSYFVYLLRSYCFPNKLNGNSSSARFDVNRFLTLGFSVIGVFLVSLGPFIYMGQLQQLLERLFPFKRGLCHAYWAPNFWALYSFADRILIKVYQFMGHSFSSKSLSSVTRGLVGDTNFAVLPNIPPLVTFVLTLFAQLPILVQLFRKPTKKNFFSSLILCGFSSFLFGWHVHEKAILLVTIPLTLFAVTYTSYIPILKMLSLPAYFSLFPLLFRPQETIIKVLILFLYVSLSDCFLSILVQNNSTEKSIFEKVYAIGFVVLCVFSEVIQPFFMPHVMPFLSHLLISIYSAIGIHYVWIQFYYQAMKEI